MVKENIKSGIPTKGRIGRFANILRNETDIDTLLEIMNGSDKYISLTPVKKALWWKNAMDKMEFEIGQKKSVHIMNACGSKCCGIGRRKKARRLMTESASIEDFLNKLSTYEVKNGELEYKLIDDHIIIAKHNRCFCGQVKKSKELFKNNIYCQCSIEFNKQFFQAAFEKPVIVKLLKSILNGSEYCEFLIKIIQ
jgi:Family of unknown function (DUF6144)